MTPERIAELRELNQVYGEIWFFHPTLGELLDALEAAQQEIAARDAEIEALREEVRLTNEHEHAIMVELSAAREEIADLKRGGVVVPEWPLDGHDDRLDEIRCWKSDPIRGVVEWNAINRTVAWMRARLRTIPADRELGEVIRRIAETKLEEDDDEYEMSWDASYSKLSEIVNDCRYALRAQPTQEPAT